jgi:hypothetical protein
VCEKNFKVMANPQSFNFAVNFNNAFNVSGPNVAVLSEGSDVIGPWFAGAEAISNGLVHRDQPLDVTVSWIVDGALAGTIGGVYTVSCYYENIGAPGSTVVLSSTTPHIMTINPQTYSLTINCPSNNLAAGMYRLVVSVTMTSNAGLPLPVAGFAEIAMLQVFNA